MLVKYLKLCCKIDFEHSRNQRQGSEFGFPLPSSPIVLSVFDLERIRNQRQDCLVFSRKVEFMRWFPVASGIFIVTRGGIRMLNHYTTPWHHGDLLLLLLLSKNISLQVNFFRKYTLLSIKDLRLKEKAKNRN